MNEAEIARAEHVLGVKTQRGPERLAILEGLKDVGEGLDAQLDWLLLILEELQVFLHVALYQSDIPQ